MTRDLVRTGEGKQDLTVVTKKKHRPPWKLNCPGNYHLHGQLPQNTINVAQTAHRQRGAFRQREASLATNQRVKEKKGEGSEVKGSLYKTLIYQ